MLIVHMTHRDTITVQHTVHCVCSAIFPTGFHVTQSIVCCPGDVGTWQNPYPSRFQYKKLVLKLDIYLYFNVQSKYW